MSSFEDDRMNIPGVARQLRIVNDLAVVKIELTRKLKKINDFAILIEGASYAITDDNARIAIREYAEIIKGLSS